MKRFISIVLAILMLVFASCDTTVNTDTSSENSFDSQTSSDSDSENIQDTSSEEEIPVDPTGTLVIYPTYPDELPRDYDYEVTVSNGPEKYTIPVYNTARHKDSYHNTDNTDSYRRFCEFGFDGEVTVSIKVKSEIRNYAILPSSKGIDSKYSNGVVTFKLTKPENIAFRINGDHNTILSIFAEPLESDVPKETDKNVIYVKAGLNNVSEHSKVGYSLTPLGEWIIPTGYSLYLEPGALVQARLTTDIEAEGIKIYGRGAVIDSRLDRVSGSLANMLFADRNKNLTVKDIKFLDAHCFNLCFTRNDDLVVKDVKVLSSEISTDGITFWGLENAGAGANKNALIEGCYLYVNDNAFVVASGNGTLVKDCTIGTDHAIMFPQGQLNSFTIDGLDVFRMGDFFRAKVDMVAENQEDASWNITMKNINAEDAISGGSLIALTKQASGDKEVVFENISLPKLTAVSSSSTTNAYFTFKNVFAGGEKLFSTSQLKVSGEGVSLNFSGSSSLSSIGGGTYKNALRNVTSKNAPTIKIGGYTVPYDQKGALEVEGYVPADNILKVLPYDGDVSQYIKEVDGVRMLPLTFFKDVLKMEVTTDENGVKMTPFQTNGNLLKNGGFENISHSYESEFSNSRDWTCFNFGGLFVEKEVVKSGKSAMRMYYKGGSQTRGLAQYISPIIKQYGAGTYRFEAYVRLGKDAKIPVALQFGLAQANWNLDAAKTRVTRVALTQNWQKVQFEVKITNPNEFGYNQAFFFAGVSAGSEKLSFYIDDAALYFVK